MDFADTVRRMVDDAVSREQEIWRAFLSHSEDYMKRLRLSTSDLEVLKRGVQGRTSMYPDLAEIGSTGFLQFTVDGEVFAFAVKNVCGIPYGGNWTECIVAICVTNNTLNNSVGGGTTNINVVPEDWHKKILHLLEGGEGGSDEPPPWLGNMRDRW